MFGKLKKIVYGIIMAVNIIVIAVMLLMGYSDRLNPETYPLLSTMGLLFPFFIAGNAVFLIAWILLRPRYAIVPIVGFIACYLPIRTYCPLNIRRDVPEEALKVVSFNVKNFDPKAYPLGETSIPPAAEYVKGLDADIVCLQEAPVNAMQRDFFSEAYEYIDTIRRGSGGSALAVLSRYPIVGKERIDYPSEGNISAAFFVLIGGDTVVVINNHLETSGLSIEDRDEFSSIVHSAKDNIDRGHLLGDTIKDGSLRLLAKLGESAQRRAPQARVVAEYIRCCDKSIILCGDFNDSPISYARHTIARTLTDCYVESANGPGWSFTQNNMRVRIDNIMCSNDWQTYKCMTDRSPNVSDHYPIIAWIGKMKNEE